MNGEPTDFEMAVGLLCIIAAAWAMTYVQLQIRKARKQSCKPKTPTPNE